MIISRQYGFVFLHNPKVAGSSVRASLVQYADSRINFFGPDPDTESPLSLIDRAHIGISELAFYYPDIWKDVSRLPFFVLYRDPLNRFLSSVNEYCRVFGDVDIRFAPLSDRKAVFLSLLDKLMDLGIADAVMKDLSLTHFRPQWIYLLPPPHSSLTLHHFNVKNIQAFQQALSDIVSAKIVFRRDNISEQFEVPRFLGRLLSNKKIKQALRGLPGSTYAMYKLRQLNSRKPDHCQLLTLSSRYGLSDDECYEVKSFIASFYARDYEAIYNLEGMSAGDDFV
jgi:hypothetical protein